jgi:hypothetical protein
MEKKLITNNTKTRRKGSMLYRSLLRLKYIFILAVLVALPLQSFAGPPNGGGEIPSVGQTDEGAYRLISYWDTRGRDSYVQVTNTSTDRVRIHVQVFEINEGLVTECEECNFDDELTGNDTHVYDVSNIMTNAIPGKPSRPACTEVLDDSHGIFVVSIEADYGYSGIGYAGGGPLIGMFRIVDALGYEYRTNSTSVSEGKRGKPGHTLDIDGYRNRGGAYDFIVNFSTVNGNTLSDLVGITYLDLNPTSVYAGPEVVSLWGEIGEEEILIWDDTEFDTSCSTTTFSCANGNLNKGIDNALPNSKGIGNRVCSSSILDSFDSGYLFMPFNQFFCTGGFSQEIGGLPGLCTARPHFVGFVGLNNGDGTGSMDSWWAQGKDKSRKFICSDGGCSDETEL